MIRAKDLAAFARKNGYGQDGSSAVIEAVSW
jgi:hypothetical protein